MTFLHRFCLVVLVWGLVWSFVVGASPAPPEFCRPCVQDDGAQCTHPGNVDQNWCTANCPNDINEPGCPASHCFCGFSFTRFCRPCQAGDPGCTYPGNANQQFCDSVCSNQVNDAICVRSHCFCGLIPVSAASAASSSVASTPAPGVGQGVDDNAESPPGVASSSFVVGSSSIIEESPPGAVSSSVGESSPPGVESSIVDSSIVESSVVGSSIVESSAPMEPPAVPASPPAPPTPPSPGTGQVAPCRPCVQDDGAQCTHPGNANQDWCTANCPNDINEPGCPASHCFCGFSVERLCRPCQAGDPGCTHPGNANQQFCDSVCPNQVNDAICVRSHCFCEAKTTGKSPRGDKFRQFSAQVWDSFEPFQVKYQLPRYPLGLFAMLIGAAITTLVVIAVAVRRAVNSPTQGSDPKRVVKAKTGGGHGRGSVANSSPDAGSVQNNSSPGSTFVRRRPMASP